jgi:hypothetical protein
LNAQRAWQLNARGIAANGAATAGSSVILDAETLKIAAKEQEKLAAAYKKEAERQNAAYQALMAKGQQVDASAASAKSLAAEEKQIKAEAELARIQTALQQKNKQSAWEQAMSNSIKEYLQMREQMKAERASQTQGAAQQPPE